MDRVGESVSQQVHFLALVRYNTVVKGTSKVECNLDELLLTTRIREIHKETFTEAISHHY